VTVTMTLPIGKTVTTEDPVVELEGGLAAGRYLVELIVETESGTVSQPVRLRLQVEEHS
jgi:hypothetical protein